jgi:hypothetical protein
VVLPTNGAAGVDAVGPTFWIGGAVTDPNSLFNEAFLEPQFYANGITTGCTSGGGYNVTYASNTYTAITDHQYVTPAGDGMHITVTDLTTGLGHDRTE